VDGVCEIRRRRRHKDEMMALQSEYVNSSWAALSVPSHKRKGRNSRTKEKKNANAKDDSLLGSIYETFVALNDLLYDRCDECGDDDFSYTYGRKHQGPASINSTEDSDTYCEKSTINDSTIHSESMYQYQEELKASSTLATCPIYRDVDEARSEMNASVDLKQEGEMREGPDTVKGHLWHNCYDAPLNDLIDPTNQNDMPRSRSRISGPSGVDRTHSSKSLEIDKSLTRVSSKKHSEKSRSHSVPSARRSKSTCSGRHRSKSPASDLRGTNSTALVRRRSNSSTHAPRGSRGVISTRSHKSKATTAESSINRLSSRQGGRSLPLKNNCKKSSRKEKDKHPPSLSRARSGAQAKRRPSPRTERQSRSQKIEARFRSPSTRAPSVGSRSRCNTSKTSVWKPVSKGDVHKKQITQSLGIPPRSNIFPWRKQNKKSNKKENASTYGDDEDRNETLTPVKSWKPSVTADVPSSVEDDKGDGTVSTELAFPVPHEDGQEIAIQDEDHCYDDPANVHSMLTMPSFVEDTIEDKHKT
jgi:hypothetical protein